MTRKDTVHIWYEGGEGILYEGEGAIGREGESER